jgi:predicted  nucleic acid-binding Zn-ribbon protein
MEKTVEQIAQEINEKLASAASKSDFDALKAEVTALKDTETISKSDFDKLDKDIQEMAEKLNKLGTAKTAVKGVATFEISKNIKKEFFRFFQCIEVDVLATIKDIT